MQSKIRNKFENAINRKYVKISKHINNLVIKRKANIKTLHKLEYVARDNNYIQIIDK